MGPAVLWVCRKVHPWVCLSLRPCLAQLCERCAPLMQSTQPTISCAVDERSAEIAGLFERMASQRPVFLGILRACSCPCSDSDIAALVSELQKHNRSVYAAATLCAMLEEVGALERVAQDGTPLAQADIAPRLVKVDGVEYLEVPSEAVGFWRTTEVGRAACASDGALDRLLAVVGEDGGGYEPIYERVLMLCADDGATAAELGKAVDRDPLVQNPRYFAMHFVERLKRCDGVAWDGVWHTTELGLRALDAMARGELRP